MLFPQNHGKNFVRGILGRTAGTVITVHRRGCTGLTGYQRRPQCGLQSNESHTGAFAHCQVIRKFMSFILTMKTNCVIVSNKFGFDFGIYMKLDELQLCLWEGVGMVLPPAGGRNFICCFPSLTGSRNVKFGPNGFSADYRKALEAIEPILREKRLIDS